MENVCNIKIVTDDTDVHVEVSGSLYASQPDRISMLCTLADAFRLTADDVIKAALLMKLDLAPKGKSGTIVEVADLRKILGREEDE